MSGPEERVQRHTVEQMGELVVVLHGLDMFTLVEQEIEVPKITLRDGIPQRAVLREPLPVEQLVEVPVLESVILARGRDAAALIGPRPLRCGVHWWMTGTRHVQWLPPEGFTASPVRCANAGRRGESGGSAADSGADRGSGGSGG